MSRRKLKTIHKTAVDPIFQSVLVEMITHRLLKKGKKQLAYKIVCEALEVLKMKTSRNNLQILDLAIQNLRPSIEIQTKRIGGAIYSVPKEIHTFRSTNLAIQLLLSCSKQRVGKHLNQKLADEIFEASKNMGNAIRKKEELHRIAESNTKITKK